MRYHLVLLSVFCAPACLAQQRDLAAQALLSLSGAVPTPSSAAPVRTDFHVRYVNGTDVYIDGGISSGLAEGVELVLKQNTSMSEHDPANAAIEPGIIAKLKIVSVATTSAVCEVVATKRDLTDKDVVSLPDSEVKNLVDKDTLGKSRQYPMVISFSEGDPLDEEVRDQVPRPPLPEVNEARGRIGFDVSTIQQLGQGSAASSEYGMVVRTDLTRLFGSHWNLNGYWRGTLQHNAATQASIQDLMNRTYLMSLSYINPNSPWTASIGRMYLPWASSLETIDGAYVGRLISPKTTLGVFAGSTPDPTAWNYDPQRRIGGSFVNMHGGNYESFHFSSTVGAGVDMLKWKVDRPFIFTENDFSFKRYFSLYHSMQVDKPTANPGTPAVSPGLGQSLLSLRVQVHPRVTLDVTDTYFRDVPTYEATLVGTGLLDKYLYQGVNGGARVTLPLHLIGYFSLGDSSNSNDKKQSLNEQIGATLQRIWKTGVQVDARYSKFDSSFASGTYRTLSISRDLGERLRANIQGGRYSYSSSLAASDNSIFINALLDMNLGARLFLQSAFTTQRGGSLDYNQWTTTLGYRFDNRAAMRRAAAQAKQP